MEIKHLGFLYIHFTYWNCYLKNINLMLVIQISIFHNMQNDFFIFKFWERRNFHCKRCSGWNLLGDIWKDWWKWNSLPSISGGLGMYSFFLKLYYLRTLKNQLFTVWIHVKIVKWNLLPFQQLISCLFLGYFDKINMQTKFNLLTLWRYNSFSSVISFYSTSRVTISITASTFLSIFEVDGFIVVLFKLVSP